MSVVTYSAGKKNSSRRERTDELLPVTSMRTAFGHRHVRSRLAAWTVRRSSDNSTLVVSLRTERKGTARPTQLPRILTADGQTDYGRVVCRGVASHALESGGCEIWISAERRRTCSGDFDGDSRRDLAVFRPAENRWYMSNSRQTSYGPLIRHCRHRHTSTGIFRAKEKPNWRFTALEFGYRGQRNRIEENIRIRIFRRAACRRDLTRRRVGSTRCIEKELVVTKVQGWFHISCAVRKRYLSMVPAREALQDSVSMNNLLRAEKPPAASLFFLRFRR